MSIYLEAVHVGRVTRHPEAGRTAFVKSAVAGPVAVSVLGLAGDAQGDKRVHGGPEMAVYSYPADHYPAWAEDLPEHRDRFVPGGMAENLAVRGVDEHGICIGDVIGIGSTVLQVSQLREPCNTLARVIGTPKVVRMMVRSGRCGWYSRVIEEGHVEAGDAHRLLDRPNPDWSVYRFSRFAAGEAMEAAALAELAALPGLAPAWQLKAGRVLAALSTRRVRA
ncbi:MOSC domain-containing protein [Polymorphobacter sp.]|uniref:MOSC domain-containing protein n=1 Tax=Polymorphobacter sp. TaxID=1909290 RepID=UPI003F710104